MLVVGAVVLHEGFISHVISGGGGNVVVECVIVVVVRRG
jgi:hypothetical protein